VRPRAPGRQRFTEVRAKLPVVLLLAVSGAACTPTLDWREVRPDDTGLTVLMPCRPTAHERGVQGLAPNGPSVSMTMHACKAGHVVYGVGWLDVATPAAVGPTMTALLEAAARNTAAVSASIVQRPVDVVGATPSPFAQRRSWRGAMPDGAVVVQDMMVFTQGLRVFQVSVLGVALREPSIPAQASSPYFESVRWATSRPL
jgi:hypothetical protein